MIVAPRFTKSCWQVSNTQHPPQLQNEESFPLQIYHLLYFKANKKAPSYRACWCVH
jgi:hypothetical protein